MKRWARGSLTMGSRSDEIWRERERERERERWEDGERQSDRVTVWQREKRERTEFGKKAIVEKKKRRME